MIVIDVGCARYGGDYSIERLIEEFKPDVLYGFDPAVSFGGEVPFVPDELKGTRVILQQVAAWTFDGQIGFREHGLGSAIELDAPKVPCFDLARFIANLDTNDIALKIDAEGAEYELLEHLIETRTDALLKLAWVEWHPPGAAVNSRPDARREAIEEKIACEMHEWRW